MEKRVGPRLRVGRPGLGCDAGRDLVQDLHCAPHRTWWEGKLDQLSRWNGAIVLTFLAGAELDPEIFRTKWKEATVEPSRWQNVWMRRYWSLPSRGNPNRRLRSNWKSDLEPTAACWVGSKVWCKTHCKKERSLAIC
jgi:hypothetical protein